MEDLRKSVERARTLGEQVNCLSDVIEKTGLNDWLALLVESLGP